MIPEWLKIEVGENQDIPPEEVDKKTRLYNPARGGWDSPDPLNLIIAAQKNGHIMVSTDLETINEVGEISTVGDFLTWLEEQSQKIPA